MRFDIQATGTSHARVGEIIVPGGVIRTPTYIPVATYGAVKALDPSELTALGAEVLIANALHLEQTATSTLIRDMGGLAQFMGWRGPLLTDSGGYQVSYMWQSGQNSMEDSHKKVRSQSSIVRITDEGAVVRSVVSGDQFLLTPELSMEIQARIGADLVVSFDQPTFDTDGHEAARQSLERSHLWTRRSWERWNELISGGLVSPAQGFFGVIQGGRFSDLRKRSAEFVINLDPDGIAVAGESIGIDPKISRDTLASVREQIPGHKLLYAMGLGGGPEGFFEAVEMGMDIFDNSSPTRMGRCGLALLLPESGGKASARFRMDIRKGKHKGIKLPLDEHCGCKVCRVFSRGYLHHLFKVGDPLGMRLLSFHNVYYMCRLGQVIRSALQKNTFAKLKAEWLG